MWLLYHIPLLNLCAQGRSVLKGLYFIMNNEFYHEENVNSNSNMQADLRCVMVCVCTLKELERLEVERLETIQQLLRQYTTLRHETDMFNQSVSNSSVFFWETHPTEHSFITQLCFIFRYYLQLSILR